MATLSIAQLKTLAQQVGLSGSAVLIAAAIAMAESGGNTAAHALTPFEDSWGLWRDRGYYPSSTGVAVVKFEGVNKEYTYPAYFWSE